MNRVSSLLSFFNRSFSSFVAIFGKGLSSSSKIQAVANSFFKNTAINRKERSFLFFLIKQFHNRFTMNNFKTNKKINSHQVLDLKNLFNKKSFFDFDILLESSKVCLRPLDITDQEHLTRFALNQDIWTYFALRMSDLTSITNYIEDALQQRASRLRYTFIIEDPITKTIMGSTAFGNFSKNDNRIEFGWSWLGKEFQGTGVNMHVKFLLSEFAFNILDLERIEAKTDVLNLRARKALIKIGMTEEGILRSHTLMPDGRRRDTIFYSILKDEWPSLQTKNFQYFDFNISILNEKPG